jgi:hypothetical protein
MFHPGAPTWRQLQLWRLQDEVLDLVGLGWGWVGAAISVAG